jgi:pyrroloquinoline quinone biosynthesis protein E
MNTFAEGQETPSAAAKDTLAARRHLRELPAPEPSAGLEAYRRERELALASSPRRRENFEKYTRSSRRSATVDYLPIKLDIENVSRCNFRCTMCVVSDWEKGKRADDMPLETFQRLIDEQYGLVEIKLQGIGEPLIQGDPYFEMIKYARARHIWVRTTTNASLLHIKDNYKKLVETDVNEIQISIDGADKSTFEAIRRGSRFEKVIENCKLINGLCREKGITRTKMWTVVQRGNQHQLEDLVRLAHEAGFSNQVFSLELTNWGLDDWDTRNRLVNVEDSLDRNRLHALVDLGENIGVKVRFWNITEKYGTDSPDKLCPWPFERAVVSSDSRTVPCCVIGNPDAYELGKGMSFLEVWNSDQYTDFRQAHLDGKIPKVCQFCYYRDAHHPAALPEPGK